MRTLLIIFVVFCTLSISSCSWNNEIAPNAQEIDIDTQLNYHWDLYDQYLSSNLDSALFHMGSIQKIAKETNKYKWLASSHGALGDVYYKEGFIGDAAYNYFEASEIFLELEELDKLANVYNMLGAIYSLAGENEPAVSYYLKAKDVFFYKGSNEENAIVNKNIAICYKDIGSLEKANSFLELSMEFANKAGKNNLVSSIYNLQGIIFSLQKMHDQARKSYFLSMSNADSLADHSRIKATAYNNIGQTYLDEGKLPEAEKYLHQALSLKKEIGDPYFLQSTLNYLAEIEIRKGRHEEAVALLEEGLNEADLHVIEEEVGKGLALLIESVSKASETPDRAKRNLHIEKLATYSKKLVNYNNNLLAVKQQIENTSKRQSLQLAEEKFSMGEELKEAQEKNAGIKFAFIIPILFLICAAITTFYTFQKNKRMEKILGSIDMVIKRKS